MIALGWMQKLDHANLPNVEANLIDRACALPAGTRTATTASRGRAG